MKLSNIFILLAVLILASCSGGDDKSAAKDQQKYPLSTRERLDAERGKITGEDGITLLNGTVEMNKKTGANKNISRGVNAYLWQASLDVISFMPIASVDATGGVIITDWYADPNAPNERMKANIVISSDELKASGVRVSLFRQTLNGGAWRDAVINPELAGKLEDKILTRAREIKIQDDRF